MKLIKNLRIDAERALCGKAFWIALLCTTAACWMNCSWDNMDNSVADIVSLLAFGSHIQLVFVCGAIPYAAAYLHDQEYGYIYSLVARSSLRSYLQSKVILTACSGFFAVFLGKILFVLMLLLRYPMVDGIPASEQGIALWIDGKPWLYFAADAAIYAIAAAGFAVMALIVSHYTRNVFVTIMSPFVLYFMFSSLAQILQLPALLSVCTMTIGVISIWETEPLITFAYILFAWTVLILAEGLLFICCAERGFYRG